MGNRVVIFPVSKEASARAYAAWTDTVSVAGPFSYVTNDAFGQWVAPYYGPPFAYGGVEVAEPAEGPAMRADGVLHDSYVQLDV